MWEQNALPYGRRTTREWTAKDDVDNVGAGRAAKGAIPTTSTNEMTPSGVFFRGKLSFYTAF